MLRAKTSGCSLNALFRMVLLPPPEGPLTIIGGIMKTLRQLLKSNAEYWQKWVVVVAVALGTREMGVASSSLLATENTFLIIPHYLHRDNTTQHNITTSRGPNPSTVN